MGLPERLLGIGLPLTIVLGSLVAAVVFPQLEILEMALLAAILAPTDAALGKPVVTNPAVPAAMREALNLESGLNDGICVPIVVLLLGLAVGTGTKCCAAGVGPAHHVGHVPPSLRIPQGPQQFVSSPSASAEWGCHNKRD